MEQPATAKISVGYTYGAVYYEPSEFEGAFGQSGGEITPNPARQEVTLWDTRTVRINHAEETIADGWSVSANHQMNPAMPNELLKGDGSVLKRDIPLMETAAGNGDPGYSGDGGPAEFAGLNSPNDVAFDAEGNMYVADTLNHRIRKIDREGIITTVAGTGNPGFSGDGGPAVNAGLNNPIGIAADSLGNLYIADRYNHRVRKIDPDGIITTVAGTGIAEYNGDEIPATAAGLNGPADISADDSGNIHIADANNHRVRRVDSDGIIHTLAGMGVPNTYDYVFAENGIGYVMSETGRHERTVDLETGVTLLTFGYDSEDRLVSITDRLGRTTLIHPELNKKS